jgi:hypothetical protein
MFLLTTGSDVPETAALELVCARCGQWLMRWTADLGRPFGEQVPILPEVPGADTVRTQSPGGYRPASDGKWYRWAPGPAARLPEGEIWSRYPFTCPAGCRTSPQARVDKLDEAAMTVLRGLHKAQTPLLRTTVDSLLRWAS